MKARTFSLAIGLRKENPYNSPMTKKTIAYFSAEYSVADNLPIYAGGLGILAGDTVQEAGAEERDFYALGLVYHETFTPGDTDTEPMIGRLSGNGFRIVSGADGQPLTVTVPIEDEVVEIRAWLKDFGTAKLILLDTRVESNSERAQQITNHLYDGAPGMMLRQQAVLAFGGVALLEELKVKPDRYHLNEGHMALVGLAVAQQHQRTHPDLTLTKALTAVKPKLVATKHTILTGAGLTLDRAMLESALGRLLKQANGSIDDIIALGAKEDGYFSTTKFLINIAGHHSGVSKIHVKAEAKAHPGSPLMAVTNGVYAPRWRAASLDGNPLEFDDRNLWEMHVINRRQLLEYVRSETGKELDPETLTVVWARRMTAYKRPDLLVSNPERLMALVQNSERPVQFVVAGRANPVDAAGTELMNRVIEASKQAGLANSLAYLPHFNPRTARLLVQGADLWLNTPIRGMEACGTSGMKASLNGALQFSTSDGWVDEIDTDGIGWVLPEENTGEALYDILEQKIAPLYYDRGADGLPDGWITKMRANIQIIEQQFTATRMLHEYYEKLYK